MGDQSSLDEDVVEEDVHHYVVPGTDLFRVFLAAANDELRVQRKPSLAAPTPRLGLFVIISILFQDKECDFLCLYCVLIFCESSSRLSMFS